jgi:hypothetical protein
MGNERRPVARAAIIENVWKLHLDTMTNVVDASYHCLRRKLGYSNDSRGGLADGRKRESGLSACCLEQILSTLFLLPTHFRRA